MPMEEKSLSRGATGALIWAGDEDARGEPLPGARRAPRSELFPTAPIELWERPRPRVQRLRCGERVSPGAGPAEGAPVSGP